MNIAKLQAQLQKVPDQALIGYVQNPDGQVPSYLALAELTRRKEIRKQAAPQQAAPTQTVAQQTVAESQPGIAQLPVREDMFNEQAMAAGGIVAFEEGGEVKRFDGRTGSYVGYPISGPGLSEADVAYQEALRNQSVTPALGTLYDYTIGLPFNMIGKGVDYIKGRQPVYDPAQGKYVLQRDLPPVDTKAAEDAAFKAKMDAGLKERQDYLKAHPQISERAIAASQPKPAILPYADPRMTADKNAAQIRADIAAGKYDKKQDIPNIGKPRTDSGIKSLGLDDLKFNKVSVDEAAFDALSPKERAMREYADEFRAELGEDPNRAKLKDRLAGMEAKAIKEEAQAPWMALAEAGLGMAAGKSQFALQNIAEGGKQGIKSFVDARDRLIKAEERRFDIESKLAQAERAEQLAAINYGAESKRTDDASRRTIGLEKQKDKARAAEVNAKGEYDAIKDKYKIRQDDRQLDIMQEHYRNSEGIQREANLISKTTALESKQRALYDKALDNARTDVMNSAKATGKEGMMTQEEYDTAIQARYLENLKAMGLPPLSTASGFRVLGVEDAKKK